MPAYSERRGESQGIPRLSRSESGMLILCLVSLGPC